MPLPKPELGLVVHYGFVWAGPERDAPLDAGKARPCVIVDIEDIEEPAAGGRPTKRVTYLPLSHVAPSKGEAGIVVPPRVAAYLGLTPQVSFIYTSYAVEDDWPFDVERRPGATDRFDYGHIPPQLFVRVAKDFGSILKKRAGGVIDGRRRSP